MRAFFAINLPTATQKGFTNLLDQLKKSLNKYPIRWTDIANIHVTLQFIPNLELNHLNELVSLVQGSLKDASQFELEFNEIELFPNSSHPRFISLAVGPNERLSQLASIIAKPIAQLGYPIETRPYRGHITLGRLRGEKPEEKEINALQISSLGPIPVNHVVLLESRPNSAGSNYFPQANFKLI